MEGLLQALDQLEADLVPDILSADHERDATHKSTKLDEQVLKIWNKEKETWLETLRYQRDGDERGG